MIKIQAKRNILSARVLTAVVLSNELQGYQFIVLNRKNDRTSVVRKNNGIFLHQVNKIDFPEVKTGCNVCIAFLVICFMESDDNRLIIL